MAAIAQATRTRPTKRIVTLVAVGPRASMAALVATAIEPAAISGAEVSDALASLKQLLEEDKAVEELPELFAFGLLAEFDVRDLVAMAAPGLSCFATLAIVPNKKSAHSMRGLKSLEASFLRWRERSWPTQ